MEGRNKGLILFGNILWLIGLILSFSYPEYFPLAFPYLTIGIVFGLAGIGIMFVAWLDFLYPSHRTSAHALGLFGNILFVIGSILFLYHYGALTPLRITFVIAGIVCIALGFLYSSHTTPPPANAQQPTSTKRKP